LFYLTLAAQSLAVLDSIWHIILPYLKKNGVIVCQLLTFLHIVGGGIMIDYVEVRFQVEVDDKKYLYGKDYRY